ncbi:MAG: hypothetical protein H6747_11580 [Deltaproteobacteria bacterium]|nr:hypothetical protein [Deltaproteobacteria bacterium]
MAPQRPLLAVRLLAATTLLLLGCGQAATGSTATGTPDAAGLSDASVAGSGDVSGGNGGDTTSAGDASEQDVAVSFGDASDPGDSDPDGGGSSGDTAGGGDTAASPDSDAADVAPPPYTLQISAPYGGQLLQAGATVEAAVKLQGPADAIATSALIWSLEDADGGNVTALTSAPAVVDGSGKASTTLTPAIGVRRLKVVAKAAGGLSATATRELVVCPAVATILQVDGVPAAEAMLAAGEAVVVKATVDGVVGPGATLELRSDLDGAIGSTVVNPTAGIGSTEVSLTVTPSSAGSHALTLHLLGGSGTDAMVCPGLGAVQVQVCGAAIEADFAQSIAGSAWKTTGDASWNAGGYLELTGNAQSKSGAVYNQALYVQPGDVRMSLRIATGGGVNGGADGFAMTILEAKAPADVDAYLAKAGKGGCLGYGVSGTCGSTKVEAFHVEIDTWINKGDPNTDPPGVSGNNAVPGQGNHIAVHTDGDAGNALLWLPEPGKPAINVEDAAWHTVVIVVKGDTLTIRLDDAVAASKTVTGLDFRGGYVIFSGSTGWASNFHRIDDLRILHQCN